MKKTIQLIAMMALMLLSACTTNNGDIGVYYGTWALNTVYVNDTLDTNWCDDAHWTTWSFQNNIVNIARSDEYQDLDSRWGTWSEEGNKLSLDYRHHSDEYDYDAPTWIYMERQTVTVLTIEKQTSKTMTLSFEDSQGRSIRYELRKIH